MRSSLLPTERLKDEDHQGTTASCHDRNPQKGTAEECMAIQESFIRGEALQAQPLSLSSTTHESTSDLLP